MSDDYYKKPYSMNAQESNDKLFVEKHFDSDWLNISMETNCAENGKITIRSKNMAEQLHFMLGQALNK